MFSDDQWLILSSHLLNLRSVSAERSDSSTSKLNEDWIVNQVLSIAATLHAIQSGLKAALVKMKVESSAQYSWISG